MGKIPDQQYLKQVVTRRQPPTMALAIQAVSSYLLRKKMYKQFIAIMLYLSYLT